MEGIKMKKRMLAVAMAATMVAACFAGCGNKTTSGSSDSEGQVYWLNFKPEADEALQGIAKTYTDQTGVPVTIVTAAEGTYNSTLTAEMDKDEAPTLFVVGNQAAVKTWGDFCYDLKDTDVYKELTTDDFTLYDGDKVASIGYCYESFGIIVNKTLLAKAGHSLDEIKNFDSLKAVADDIHANAATLGFDAFTSSGMDDSSSWRFSGHLANMPLYYEAEADGWDGICPATIKGTYLDNYKKIWDLYTTDAKNDKATLADAGYDAETEFLNGEAVFYQNGSWEYSALSEKYSDDELAMIPIYVGVEGEENQGLCSGTENCWAVNANASEEDIQATLDFMKWMVTSEEGTKCMAEQFGVIPYKGAQENTNLFIKQGDEMREAGKYTVDWTFNLTPNVDDWRAGVVSAINQYDAGGSWDDVVSAFVDGWATQYQAAQQ